MSYARDAFDALEAELLPGDQSLLLLYTLLVLTKGERTTLEDVHDAWSLWRMCTRPDHPALVPFGDLAGPVQELDRPYLEAIHRAAAKIGIVAR